MPLHPLRVSRNVTIGALPHYSLYRCQEVSAWSGALPAVVHAIILAADHLIISLKGLSSEN
jgi:hypothetical protein